MIPHHEKNLLLYICHPSRHKAFLLEYLSGGGDADQLCQGTTALCEASRSGKENMVNKLLHHGANINTCDSTGNTPLHVATLNQDYLMVETLVMAHADTELPNALGYTPIMSAIDNRDYDCCATLLDWGANINYRWSEGFGKDSSLLHQLLFNKVNTDIADLAICAGAHPVNVKCSVFKFFNLILADSYTLDEFIRLLLAAGSRIMCDTPEHVTKMMKYATSLQQDMIHVINKANTTPATLEELSRVVIRRQLADNGGRTHISHKISELPLPEQIQQYLELGDLTMSL